MSVEKQVAINLDAMLASLKAQRNDALDEVAFLGARNAQLENENKLLLEENEKLRKSPEAAPKA